MKSLPVSKTLESDGGQCIAMPGYVVHLRWFDEDLFKVSNYSPLSSPQHNQSSRFTLRQGSSFPLLQNSKIIICRGDQKRYCTLFRENNSSCVLLVHSCPLQLRYGHFEPSKAPSHFWLQYLQERLFCLLIVNITNFCSPSRWLFNSDIHLQERLSSILLTDYHESFLFPLSDGFSIQRYTFCPFNFFLTIIFARKIIS